MLDVKFASQSCKVNFYFMRVFSVKLCHPYKRIIEILTFMEVNTCKTLKLQPYVVEEHDASELGTQNYWEDHYKEEIENFSSHGDPGEIWFGEDILNRIIRWMESSDLIRKYSKIVDIGCGNGVFLSELANEGYTNLTGLDYSVNAVTLAKQIAKRQDLNILYFICDILEGLQNTYDVIHDKGTYDAISLTENAKENRLKYIENVYKSLSSNGVLIITSCNWTQSELDQQFAEKFGLLAVIPTPQFKFGGKVGSVVSSCVFKKK